MPKPSTSLSAPSAKSVDVEIVTDADDLAALAEQAASHRDAIIRHEDAFEQDTLPERLCIGLACARAHAYYALSAAEAGARKGKEKSHSRRESLSAPASFKDWLATMDWLKEPTAYKYMAGLTGLSLDYKATPEQVRMTLESLRHSNAEAELPAPTLGLLVKAAKRLAKPEEPEQAPPPPDTEELRIGDAREAVAALEEDFLDFVRKGHLDNLPKEDLTKFKETILGWRDRVNARLK